MWNNREKSIAVRQLVLNLGDVPKTADETGIPLRTLQRWKNELQTRDNLICWELDSRAYVVHSRYQNIRDAMLVQIERLLHRMADAPASYLPDYAMAVARLTDRIHKIEAILEMSGQFVIEVRAPGDSPDVDTALTRLAGQPDAAEMEESL